MKKIDIMTIVGLIAACVLIVIGMTNGGSLKQFWDIASIQITVGGSIGAVLISYPTSEIKKMFKVYIQSFKSEPSSKEENIELFVNLAKKARRDGLLSLEDDIEEVENEYIKKGLNMIVDGIEPESIREIMTLEIQEMEKRHDDAAAMFSTWGAYAPAMGMIGTLIGLIQMLADLSDMSSLGSGMAVALITTFYGSLLANVFLLPVASKLNYKTAQEVNTMEMAIEGVLSIQSGVNPRIIEEKMIVYLSPSDRKEYLANVNVEK